MFPYMHVSKESILCMYLFRACTYGKHTYVKVWKRWKRNPNICTKDLHIWKETNTYGKETYIKNLGSS